MRPWRRSSKRPVPPKPFHRSERKLNSLRLSLLLKRGGLVAHYTSTIAGVAALPKSRKAIRTLQHFKQRRGPFLLLADSVAITRRLIRWYPSGLRKLIGKSWPGRSTLIVPGRPGLPRCCYERGRLAIRVDADPACRRLAKTCGGLLVSSSLNRRGGEIHRPSCLLQMRWHRFLDGRAGVGAGSGEASEIFSADHRRLQKIR